MAPRPGPLRTRVSVRFDIMDSRPKRTASMAATLRAKRRLMGMRRGDSQRLRCWGRKAGEGN